MSKLFRIAGFASLCWMVGMGLVSCGSTRSLVYMQGTFDTTELSKVDIPEPVVRRGDLLSIIVYSDNPQATALYNQSLVTVSSGAGGESSQGGGGSTGGTQGAGASPTTSGYLVDDNGNIQFQGLGRLHLEGLTISQVRDTLDSRLKLVLRNPYYNIRFLNYRFTMLGEVNKPGIYSIPGEHVSILEAIGMAGDLTFFAKRDNVLVIRENNGKREFARLDLTKPQIMASPYFYLQQNDMVIIDPNKKRIAASDVATTRNITIAVSIVSIVVLMVSILKK